MAPVCYRRNMDDDKRKTVRLPIRLTNRTRKALGRAATRNHRTSAGQAVVYIEQALRDGGYLVGDGEGE